jgi:hypothetical protein
MTRRRRRRPWHSLPPVYPIAGSRSNNTEKHKYIHRKKNIQAKNSSKII